MVNREGDATLAVMSMASLLPEQCLQVNEQHWSQFDVTAALRPGPNLIVMQMPRAIICYRAYLSKEPPRQYPQLGPQKNAQWADLVAWNIETRGAQIRRGAEMIRQVDPERSINFMAADDYSDPVKKACQDYGGRFHDTGAMAGFWTDWNTLMMSGAGLPVTAEPGNGAPNPREFQLFWGRWLTEGVNGVHYFQNWGEIAWNPECLKVFEANLPMYRAVGKYHAPFAKVAVLFSAQNAVADRLSLDPGTRTAGRLLLRVQRGRTRCSNYCPRDGIGAEDFGTPSVDRFRVIVDSNSMFMDEALIAGIEKYVRQGGVFITYGQTGRHDPVQPDSWPISRLTGYEVVRTLRRGTRARPSRRVPGEKVFGPQRCGDRRRAAPDCASRSARRSVRICSPGRMARRRSGCARSAKAGSSMSGPLWQATAFLPLLSGAPAAFRGDGSGAGHRHARAGAAFPPLHRQHRPARCLGPVQRIRSARADRPDVPAGRSSRCSDGHRHGAEESRSCASRTGMPCAASRSRRGRRGCCSRHAPMWPPRRWSG